MFVMMRTGSVESNSMAILFFQADSEAGQTLDEVLRTLAKALLEYRHGEDMYDILDNLFRATADNDLYLDEVGINFWPNTIDLKFDEIVQIHEKAEKILIESLTGLANSAQDNFDPTRKWWEKSIELPAFISAY